MTVSRRRSIVRVVRGLSDRRLRRLRVLRSLRRAARRRTEAVRSGVPGECCLRRADHRSSTVRRQRTTAAPPLTDQGSTVFDSPGTGEGVGGFNPTSTGRV